MLPFAIPPYVKASKEHIAECYELHLVGLASDEITGIVFDDKVALEQIHPGYTLALLPLSDEVNISSEEAAFYAEYLSYLHETPAAVDLEDFLEGGIQFLLNISPPEQDLDSLTYNLLTALESIRSLRWGSLGLVHSAFSQQDSDVHPLRLAPQHDYGTVAQELYLYATAMRQLDFGSEYLNFYRVIEAISGNNGVNWLESNIPRIAQYKFPVIVAEGVETGPNPKRIDFDLLATLRERALELLKAHNGPQETANHLYQLRNGIAHGKRQIQRSDLSMNPGEVYQWTPVLRLLARIGIEDKRASRSISPGTTKRDKS